MLVNILGEKNKQIYNKNKQIKFMTTSEILENLRAQLELLETEHAKSSKAAAGRARRAANEIKKLAADYKKTSLAESK
jgi:hypothetical protein